MTRTIRPLNRAELDTLLDWAASEGWNPGLDDAHAFWAADPTGFLGAFVDGAMVAGISAVAYDANFGFIGLYICHPHWRGQGHGKALWNAAMDYLGDRTVGLDGVPEQQENYASMGFVPCYETIRMSGRLAQSAPEAPAPDLSQVLALDQQCFPSSRRSFLEHWMALPNQTAAITSEGTVEAFAVLRPCRRGHKIGPVIAPSPPAALALLSAFSGDVDIDVPAHQSEFLAALSAAGFAPTFRTARMYRGPFPLLAAEKVFAITSLELG